MEAFVKGEIVVISFPFSDFSSSKKRPALVVTSLKGNDLILCQISSQESRDEYSIKLSQSDFKSGNLKNESNIRPNKLLTADKSIILYKMGTITKTKLEESIEKICKILRE